MKYRIGVCQFKPILMDVEYNSRKIEELLTGIEADLIVLPELALTGYLFSSREELRQVSEDAYTGRTARQLKKLAAANKTSYALKIGAVTDAARPFTMMSKSKNR